MSELKSYFFIFGVEKLREPQVRKPKDSREKDESPASRKTPSNAPRPENPLQNSVYPASL